MAAQSKVVDRLFDELKELSRKVDERRQAPQQVPPVILNMQQPGAQHTGPQPISPIVMEIPAPQPRIEGFPRYAAADIGSREEERRSSRRRDEVELEEVPEIIESEDLPTEVQKLPPQDGTGPGPASDLQPASEVQGEPEVDLEPPSAKKPPRRRWNPFRRQPAQPARKSAPAPTAAMPAAAPVEEEAFLEPAPEREEPPVEPLPYELAEELEPLPETEDLSFVGPGLESEPEPEAAPAPAAPSRRAPAPRRSEARKTENAPPGTPPSAAPPRAPGTMPETQEPSRTSDDVRKELRDYLNGVRDKLDKGDGTPSGPSDLLDYLGKLSDYLPENEKKRFRGSNERLAMESLKARLAGQEGSAGKDRGERSTGRSAQERANDALPGCGYVLLPEGPYGLAS